MAKMDSLRNENTAEKNLWGGNIAVLHDNGTLTDGRIKKMTNAELETLAFVTKNSAKFVCTEWYRRTLVEKDSNQKMGEVFQSVHRARIELRVRDEEERKRAMDTRIDSEFARSLV